MSARVKGFAVVLEADMSAEDAQVLANALLCLKGVVRVEALERNAGDFLILGREKSRIAQSLDVWMQKELFGQ